MKKLLFGLCVTLLITAAHGQMTLGSIADIRSLSLEKGDIGDFKASFFSLGDKPLYLDYTLEYPNDLRVEIYPKKLTVRPGATDTSDCSGCEFFILADGKTYVRTYPVHVYVKIPPEISRNIYEIKLTVKARDSDNGEGNGIQQSMVQVREITFTAYVPGDIKAGGIMDGKTNVLEEYKTETNYSNPVDTPGTGSTGIKDLSGPSSPRSDTGSSGQDTSGQNQGSSQGDSAASTGNPQATGAAGNSTASGQNSGSGLIQQDAEGKTKINLPTGDVVLSKQDSDTAVDLGIVTLVISVISLLVKILK